MGNTGNVTAPLAVEIRPRTTGEIMDDACRLALADAPLLLALSGLFVVPAACIGLLLLALPQPESWGARLVLPALAGLLLPLTGLGSGACQELLRRRAEGEPVTLGGCLRRALRRGLDHTAARAVGLGLLVPVGVGLALPGGTFVAIKLLVCLIIFVAVGSVPLVLGGPSVHAIIAGEDKNWFAAYGASGRESRRQPGKIAAVVCTRPLLLLMALVNLFLLVHVLLWVAESLLGFDLALPGVVLGMDNSLFLVILTVFAWIVLTPFFEACNYLLHTDARARYEGLDLWYRVRRLFPVMERRAAVVLLLGFGMALVAPSVAAADTRLDAVRAARRELAAITREVQATEPYRNGTAWLARLTNLAALLERDASERPGGYHWVTQALTGFQRQDKEGALAVLRGIDGRLATIEDSLMQPPEEDGAGQRRSKADIKSLLPPAPEEAQPTRPATKPRPTRREEPVREEEPFQPRQRVRQGSGAIGPSSAGGFGPLMWLLIAAALAGTLVAALVLYQRRRPVRKLPSAVKTKNDALSLESLLTEADKQGGEGLWRQADELARTGKLRDAVRTLYLAVLAVLHRADLIRYSPTRTNGEYVRQLRDKTDVQRPFRGLTGLFEVKWYGERHCEPVDYDTCRRLAEEVREGMSAQPQGA
jgi:Domain of unknown function (DUF4129)